MSQRTAIDTLAFARQTGSLEGELPVASLTRTIDLLADTAGNLKYRVEGGWGARSRPQLVLKLDGMLSVRCQRCLEGVDFPLHVQSVLEFVDDEDSLTQEEIEDDTKDFLPAQSEVDVLALIEDEVILSLPVAPRHERCALPEAGQGGGKISPFSVLKGFKGKAS